MVVDQMHQPWRTFASVINKCLFGKITGLDKIRLSRAQILWGMYYNKNGDFVELLWEDFVFQIDNRDHKKQEKIYYPRFTKVIIHHFISKDTSISMRNKIFMHTIRDDSVLGTLRFVSKSDEYQVYGELLPERMTNQQMRDSPAYKNYLAFATGAATPKKERKFKKRGSPSKKKDLVAVEEPVEKPVKKPAARRQSAGVQIRDTPSVSVSKKKEPAKAERSKGIELLFEVASLEEAQLKKAIKRSKRETNIHQEGGSSEGVDLESEVPDDPKGKSIAQVKELTDDEEEDEFIHTPDDYVPTDDENIDDEEFERINKEMYSDVNVELKDSECEGKGKDDEEMTDAEHENVSQEVGGDQVKGDAHATVIAVSTTQKTEVPLQSSSISSDYAIKFLNFDNIPPDQQLHKQQPTTTATDSSTLTTIHQRLSDIENEVKTLRNVDHSSTIRAAVKFKVPIIVKEYLRTSLDDALHKALQRHTVKLVKEHSVPAYVTDMLQQQPKPQKSAADIHKIKMEQAGKQQEPKYTISAQVKEIVFEAGDTQVPQNLGEDTGNTDEPPVVKANPKDWFKKPERPPTPDPKWNEGKTVDNKPTHKWLSNLAKAETSSKTFNDLMSTPIDFSAFVMNRLQISDLKQDILVVLVDYFFNNDLAYLQGESTGRTYTTSLTKTKAAKYDLPGIEDMVPNLWSPIKVAYDKHALLVTNVKVNVWYVYGHLEEIEVRRSDQQLYKFMEGDFLRLHLKDIKDMLLLVVQNRLFNLKGEDIVHLAAALHMFTRRIVIQKRLEDLQFGVESYQKKLNLSKPRTREEDLSRRAPYTTLSDPQGVIYEDKLNRKRLMRSDELYKFSDGTLQSVCDTLHDMATNLRMGYNKAMPKRR
ncbi:hypothetical protein Tco_0228545 [Tanacetum coccineum]